jgi:hypothetical protein
MRAPAPLNSRRRKHPQSGRFALAVAVAMSAVSSARCNLPHGNDNLPSTAVPGVNRDAVIRLLAPPSVRRIGETIPITVDVELASSRLSASGVHCIKLAASPGVVTFPLGNSCPEGGGVASGLGEGGSSGCTPADPGADGAGAPALSTAQSCVRPQASAAGRYTNVELAAYLPEGDESSATFFGAVYATSDCSGCALATTSTVLHLRGEEEGDAGAGPEGGAPNGTGGASSGASNAAGGAPGAGGAASGGEGGQ